MGKKKGGSKKKQNGHQDGLLWVDPAMVRFQHSKIRPYFSSCGRALTDTLDMIRQGDMAATDLPPIQVLIGPETEDGQWYFSLNNRRLWVLKRCREEQLLASTNNRIPVRVRPPKSAAEALRYTLDNCAVEAKVLRESPASSRTPHSKGKQQPSTGPTTLADEDAVDTTDEARALVSNDSLLARTEPL